MGGKVGTGGMSEPLVPLPLLLNMLPNGSFLVLRGELAIVAKPSRMLEFEARVCRRGVVACNEFRSGIDFLYLSPAAAIPDAGECECEWAGPGGGLRYAEGERWRV